MYHTLVWGYVQNNNVPYISMGSLYLYTNARLLAHTRLRPKFRLRRTTSAKTWGRGGLKVTGLLERFCPYMFSHKQIFFHFSTEKNFLCHRVNMPTTGNREPIDVHIVCCHVWWKAFAFTWGGLLKITTRALVTCLLASPANRPGVSSVVTRVVRCQ